MLKINNVFITRGVHTLIENINFAVYAKDIVGIVGANGCGKSTLFAAIKSELETAKGDIEIGKNIRIQALEQETPALNMPAIRYVISGDTQLFQVLEKLEKAEISENYDIVMRCHQHLSDLDGYSADARAAKILAGLGFNNNEIYNAVSSFSGGWRMRLNLAKCLFGPSDLLLLDEPTNHLDMEAIIWLENFLRDYQGAILLVSHDRDFLDRTVTHIAHIENQRLKLYKGDFTSFEIERANAIRVQQAQYKSQQAQITHAMKFVQRFRYKATKARQAQSRLKAIEKMELIAPVYEKSPFTFSFMEPKSMPNPMITMRQVNLGYDDEKTILWKVNFNLMPGQRIGLLGINGAGKSTFIKGLCGSLDSQKGIVEKFPGTKIGYFAQHQVDHLNVEESPFHILKDLANNISEKDIISYFGRYNFDRDKSYTQLKYFSGGEKARVALALMIWQRPNLLLLDEPTNHLDLEMRQALIFALEAFAGTLILVSHDRYLLRTLVDDLYLIHSGNLARFDGTVEDYQAMQ